jgi:hypothetical protein
MWAPLKHIFAAVGVRVIQGSVEQTIVRNRRVQQV